MIVYAYTAPVRLSGRSFQTRAPHARQDSRGGKWRRPHFAHSSPTRRYRAFASPRYADMLTYAPWLYSVPGGAGLYRRRATYCSYETGTRSSRAFVTAVMLF